MKKLFLFLLPFLLLTVILFKNPSFVLARGGCFAKDTPILTPSGYKKVQDLKKGDQVMSYNFETNQKQISQVGEIQSFDRDEYYLLNNTVKVTATHPFYVKRQNSYQVVEVQDLKLGDILVSENLTNVPLFSIKKHQETLTVYNLINVTPNNNYFAGGFLVHNKGGGGGGGGGGGFGGHSYGGVSYTCSSYTDPKLRDECNKRDTIYGGATIFFLIGIFAVSILSSLSRGGLRFRRVNKSGSFTNDQSLVNFTKQIIPAFKNTYSSRYSTDNEIWRQTSPKKELDQQNYFDFISKDELIKKVKGLYINYQTDWSKKDFAKMRDYVNEPYYTSQLNIFSRDFGDNFDIVYNPEVDSITPLKFERTDSGAKLRVQLNGRMVDFEVSPEGEVLSGEPNVRKFSEYWIIYFDNAKNARLEGIVQIHNYQQMSLLMGILWVVVIGGYIAVSLAPSFTSPLPPPSVSTVPSPVPYPQNLPGSGIPNTSPIPINLNNLTSSTSGYLLPNSSQPVLDSTAIFNAINSFRKQNNLDALDKSPELCELAQKRADYLINNPQALTAPQDQQQISFNSQTSGYSGAELAEDSMLNAYTNLQVLNTWESGNFKKDLLATQRNGDPITKGCVQTKVSGQSSIAVFLTGDR